MVALLAGGGPLAGAERRNAEEIWRQYVEWGTRRRLRNILPQFDYRDQLLADGFPLAEVEERVRVVEDRLLYSGGMRYWYNRLFAREASVFRVAPNAFLLECIRGIEPGRALAVAMGQGRNAIHLARQGWRVTGFDVSDVGLAVARSRAARLGVQLATVHSSYTEFDYGQQAWDLILLLYAFVTLSDTLAGRLTAALCPGGRLVFEHLAPTPETENLRPLGIIGMASAAELTRLFGGLRVVRSEEVVTTPDWGPAGPVPLVRLLAEKR